MLSHQTESFKGSVALILQPANPNTQHKHTTLIFIWDMCVCVCVYVEKKFKIRNNVEQFTIMLIHVWLTSMTKLRNKEEFSQLTTHFIYSYKIKYKILCKSCFLSNKSFLKMVVQHNIQMQKYDYCYLIEHNYYSKNNCALSAQLLLLLL